MNLPMATRCELVPLRRCDDERGSLCSAHVARDIPFEVHRVYWVFGVPDGTERAHHAHREQHEFLVAVRGRFTVHCDEGHVESVYELDRPDRGLLLRGLVWHHLSDFSPDAVCLVLASGPYEPEEYVFDYDEFRALVARR